MLLILTLVIYSLLYNTILKKRLKETRNYLQCDTWSPCNAPNDTNANKNDTDTTIRLLTI